MRQSISTERVPSRAVMNRQPNGSRPKSHSPMPMTYLPTGGWTTYEASVGICTEDGSARIEASAFFGQLTS